MDLDRAMKLAVKAYSGEKDRGGAPHILHAIRVMMRMETETEMIVALLHAVIEDGGPVTMDNLVKTGFSDDVLDAVECLTRLEGQAFDDHIRRCEANPLARKILVADLDDEMNIIHLLGREEKERESMERFRSAYRLLSDREWTPGAEQEGVSPHPAPTSQAG